MPQTRYTRTAIYLHWIIAALMIFMLFWGGGLMRVRPGTSMADWQPSAHASIGILILLLALSRLLWRMGHVPPPLPAGMPRWQVLASHLTHGALYALMIAIPVLGLLAIVPYGASRLDVDQVTFFRLFPVAFLPNLGEWTANAHELLATVAKILVILHIAAALKHQFWYKDGLLRLISPHGSPQNKTPGLVRARR